MPDISQDIQTLAAFQRKPRPFLERLKKSKLPVVLTVGGKAALVVQDAHAYQHLLDLAAAANANEGIRQGMNDAKQGKIRLLGDFFSEFENRHGLRRKNNGSRRT